MDETLYHSMADATLADCYEKLDAAFASGALEELELQNGILHIVTQSGTTLILNKHTASRQLWLAVPDLGGLHFRYDAPTQRWTLPDGRDLYAALTHALAAQNITVAL